MAHYTDWPDYPTEVLNLTDYPTQTDDVDDVSAWLVNALVHEMIAVQDELGTQPKGSFADVKARLDNLKLAANTTVNFNNSMSAADIQALIDAQPRYVPYSKTLTFQFADGTYTLSSSLIWEAFHGGGTINIYGNTGESGLHSNQAVYFNFSGTDCNGIVLRNCNCHANIKCLKVAIKTSTANRNGIWINESSSYIFIYSCYILGNSISYGYAIRADTAHPYANSNYVSNTLYGISSIIDSSFFSYNNDDTGTKPKYGLYAGYNGAIGKGSTQPTGSTANEFTRYGSIIR